MNSQTLIGEFGSIEKNIITILAVAGGFFVGLLLTQFLIGGVSKFVLKHETNQKLKRFGGIAGGVGLAILVYSLLTGDGSFGLGGRGGGEKSRNQSSEGKDKTTPNEQPKKETSPDQPQAKLPDRDEQVIVHLLSVGAVEPNVYAYGDESKPIDLKEVLRRIDERASEGHKPVKVVHIVAKDKNYSVYYESILKSKLRERGIKFLSPN
jgi:hypothetical protein